MFFCVPAAKAVMDKAKMKDAVKKPFTKFFMNRSSFVFCPTAKARRAVVYCCIGISFHTQYYIIIPRHLKARADFDVRLTIKI